MEKLWLGNLRPLLIANLEIPNLRQGLVGFLLDSPFSFPLQSSSCLSLFTPIVLISSNLAFPLSFSLALLDSPFSLDLVGFSKVMRFTDWFAIAPAGAGGIGTRGGSGG